MLHDLALCGFAVVALAVGLWASSGPLPTQWEPPMGFEMAQESAHHHLTVEFDTGL